MVQDSQQEIYVVWHAGDVKPAALFSIFPFTELSSALVVAGIAQGLQVIHANNHPHQNLSILLQKPPTFERAALDYFMDWIYSGNGSIFRGNNIR
jgi:hypothetical protein